MPRRSRLPFAALGFGIVALLSSWNALAAPFGLVVGLASAALAIRALRRRDRRPVAAAALATAALAVVASGLVLALTAGVGRELAGTPVLVAPDPADVGQDLDRAAERTREARERAARQLEALELAEPGHSPEGVGTKR